LLLVCSQFICPCVLHIMCAEVSAAERILVSPSHRRDDRINIDVTASIINRHHLSAISVNKKDGVTRMAWRSLVQRHPCIMDRTSYDNMVFYYSERRLILVASANHTEVNERI